MKKSKTKKPTRKVAAPGGDENRIARIKVIREFYGLSLIDAIKFDNFVRIWKTEAE